ncbi:MAG: sugar ABC transporter permease [Defluviitaleaceae bacterium]|nr:sugar ABC transporter permease [Defluviitaleaceae bacterium]MCL2274374.1 sugar ABC transporter permease [Defluviitaleaceae bacterium]
MTEQKRKRRTILTMERRWGLAGVAFVSPFIIGFFMLFLFPAITSVRRAFVDVTWDQGREVWTPVGLDNFQHIFFRDPEYLQLLIDYFMQMLPQLVIVLIFSMFIALMLQQNFRGRTLARAIFFVPVIVSSGIVMNILGNDLTNQAAQESTALFMNENRILMDLMIDAQLGAGLIEMVIGIISQIFDLAWRSGVQILIFLSALIAIPKSFYEASTIEGASAWSTYWKITFPMISPYILVCVVYTIVDSFTDYDNELINYIYQNIRDLFYGTASAMSWVYTLAVFVVLGIILGLTSRRVFYMVD